MAQPLIIDGGSVRNLGTTPLDVEDIVIDGFALFQDGGSNVVRVSAPGAISADYTLRLPDAQSGFNQPLLNDGSGNLRWGRRRTDQRTYEQTGHGFSLGAFDIPIPVYWDPLGAEWVQASTTTEVKEAFIVEVPDANTLVLQTSGYHELQTGHGLIDGSYYFLTDTAPFYIPTLPTTGVVHALWRVEVDRLELLAESARMPSASSDLFILNRNTPTAGLGTPVVWELSGGAATGTFAIAQDTDGFPLITVTNLGANCSMFVPFDGVLCPSSFWLQMMVSATTATVDATDISYGVATHVLGPGNLTTSESVTFISPGLNTGTRQVVATDYSLGIPTVVSSDITTLGGSAPQVRAWDLKAATNVFDGMLEDSPTGVFDFRDVGNLPDSISGTTFAAPLILGWTGLSGWQCGFTFFNTNAAAQTFTIKMPYMSLKAHPAD